MVNLPRVVRDAPFGRFPLLSGDVSLVAVISTIKPFLSAPVLLLADVIVEVLTIEFIVDTAVLLFYILH